MESRVSAMPLTSIQREVGAVPASRAAAEVRVSGPPVAPMIA